MEPLLLTVAEAAKLLKTNTTTVYKLIKEKKLVALKLGAKKNRYETLKEFVANEEKIQNEKI